MNLTLSVPDSVLEHARVIAHEQGTSVNALVRNYLERLTGRADGEELSERFTQLWSSRAGHSDRQRFSRDELYEDRIGKK